MIGVVRKSVEVRKSESPNDRLGNKTGSVFTVKHPSTTCFHPKMHCSTGIYKRKVALMFPVVWPLLCKLLIGRGLGAQNAMPDRKLKMPDNQSVKGSNARKFPGARINTCNRLNINGLIKN